MSDPRVMKLAQVLVDHSLEVQPGWQLVIDTTPLGEELALEVYAETLKRGAHPFILCQFPRSLEILFRTASDEHLAFISPFSKMIYETPEAYLQISAIENTRGLSGVDPAKIAIRQKAQGPLMQTFVGRMARGELHWCLTEFPTQASAQEADMSLADYQDFVFSACKLNLADPVAAWRQEGERLARLSAWLKGHDRVVIKGKNIDLSLSIRGRTFIPCNGHENLPDGEIFTGPVEDSANGWVRFSYPAIFNGREAADVELWFENGKVIRENASKGQDMLTEELNSDAGARYLGELGIGTNYNIPRFTKNMLFDEKLGGTIHLAVGASLPETGGKNRSGLHWDMLCDMHDGEISVDGELFYRDGKPVIGEQST